MMEPKTMTRVVLNRLRLYGLVLVFLGFPTSSLAQTVVTIEVRKKLVSFKEDNDYLLIRPKASVTEWKDPFTKIDEWGEKIIASQGRLTEVDPKPYLNKFNKELGRMVPLANGILVPRIKGLRSDHLSKITNGLDGAGWVEPVYRFEIKSNGQVVSRLVLLSGSISARFTERPNEGQLSAIKEKLKLSALARDSYDPPEIVRFNRDPNSAEPFKVAELLRKDAKVRWAEPDLVSQIIPWGTKAQAPIVPDDTWYSKQWYLPRIEIPAAWAITTGKVEITVAVLDDGVDVNHDDLKKNIGPNGWNVYDQPSNNDPRPEKPSAHGTACSGIIAGVANNGQGIAGIAWKCKILPIRISGGPHKFAGNPQISAAIRYAKAKGAKILNCSWGLFDNNRIYDAIEEVSSHCLVIASTGNSGSLVDFPACHQDCLGVGALRRDNTLWSYSCYGPDNQVFLVAPTGDIELKGDVWTTDHSKKNGYNPGNNALEEDKTGDYTGRFGGTSASAPMVSGVAALVWSAYPQLTPMQVRECLRKSAEIVDQRGGDWNGSYSKKYGYGVVNAKKALTCAESIVKGQKKEASLPEEGSAASRQTSSSGECPKGKESALSQLEAALRPSPEFVKVRKKVLELKPLADSIVVRGPKGVIPRDSNFWKAVVWGKVPADLSDKEVGRLQGEVFYLIPRTALMPESQLKNAAMVGDLPIVLPAYECQKELWIPQGTFTLKVTNAKSIPDAVQLAKKWHLRIIQTEDQEITMELTRESPCRSVFDAVRMFEKMSFTRWCEPDSFQPLR